MIAIAALITVVGLIAIGPASGTGAILDPCTLVTAADLQQAFPGAGAGKLDRSLEKDGMLKCTWSYPGGQPVRVGQPPRLHLG